MKILLTDTAAEDWEDFIADESSFLSFSLLYDKSNEWLRILDFKVSQLFEQYKNRTNFNLNCLNLEDFEEMIKVK